MRGLNVISDIILQSQDNFLIKSQFFISFLFHYIGKTFGLDINFFPKMRIRLGDCMFITRKKTIDFWMLWKDYEKDIAEGLDKIKDKGTFIDVGANIGRYSILMAKGGWKVYAFEPIKSNFLMLKKHSKMNKVEKSINSFNLALGDKKEQREIYFEPYKHGEASIMMKNKNSVSERIKINKLGNMLLNKKLKKPIIMKIDVEGFEYEVLLGAKKFIKESEPIIIIEIWNKKTVDFLKRIGYKQKRGFWYTV